MSQAISKSIIHRKALVEAMIGGLKEISTAIPVADVAGSIGGARAIKEESTVTTVADVAGSLGGYSEVSEVSSVDTVADVAGSLNSKYFDINSTTVAYRVWFDVNNTNTPPAAGGKTLVEVEVATNATAATVATNIKTVLDALGGAGVIFSCVRLSNALTITHVVEGACTNVAAGDSGFTVGVDTAGITYSAATYFLLSKTTVDYYVWFNVDSHGGDPLVALRTGISVPIATGYTAAQVAAAILTALVATAFFTVSVGGAGNNVLTITAKLGGACTNAGAGTSGFTASTSVQGVAAVASKYFTIVAGGVTYYIWFNASGNGADPAPGGTGIEVPISTNSTAAVIAQKLYEVIGAMDEVFTASIDGTTVTITAVEVGSNTDINVGTSTFTVAVGTQGTGLAQNSYEIITLPAGTINIMASVQSITETVQAFNASNFTVEFIAQVESGGEITALPKAKFTNKNATAFSGKLVLVLVAI